MKPHRLFNDDDGHWYLIPEENYGYFETMASLAEEDSSIYDSEEWCCIEQYAIDNPATETFYK